MVTCDHWSIDVRKLSDKGHGNTHEGLFYELHESLKSTRQIFLLIRWKVLFGHYTFPDLYFSQTCSYFLKIEISGYTLVKVSKNSLTGAGSYCQRLSLQDNEYFKVKNQQHVGQGCLVHFG